MSSWKKLKIGVLTGGGDAPGLNAVICSLTRTCIADYGYELIGYKFGYRGLYYNDFIPLTNETASGLMHRGGSILYCSNKDNLFDYTVVENGVKVKKDVSDIAIENMKKEDVDVLCVLGGDGTLTSARDFARKGVNVIGVPKTIDNDLGATEITFGFNSAVSIVVEALGRVHTTAESHHRVIVVEVMGRSAGHIAIQSGIAGSADVILIPEIPYSTEIVVDKICERDKCGKPFTIIVVTEGAKEKGGEAIIGKIVEDSPDPIRFSGVAAKISANLEAAIKARPDMEEHEIRSVVLGHVQRGGEPTAFDRVLSARYGLKAATMIHDERFGYMAALKKGQMTEVSLEEVIGENKYVDPKGELVRVARALGITFGDHSLGI